MTFCNLFANEVPDFSGIVAGDPRGYVLKGKFGDLDV